MSDFIEKLLRCHLIRTRRWCSDLQSLFQACNPHLKELIKIRAGNTQETHPLEQRYGIIPGLRKHSLVELQEAEFTVDVPVDRWCNWRVQLQIL